MVPDWRLVNVVLISAFSTKTSGFFSQFRIRIDLECIWKNGILSSWIAILSKWPPHFVFTNICSCIGTRISRHISRFLIQDQFIVVLPDPIDKLVNGPKIAKILTITAETCSMLWKSNNYWPLVRIVLSAHVHSSSHYPTTQISTKTCTPTITIPTEKRVRKLSTKRLKFRQQDGWWTCCLGSLKKHYGSAELISTHFPPATLPTILDQSSGYGTPLKTATRFTPKQGLFRLRFQIIWPLPRDKTRRYADHTRSSEKLLLTSTVTLL